MDLLIGGWLLLVCRPVK